MCVKQKKEENASGPIQALGYTANKGEVNCREIPQLLFSECSFLSCPGAMATSSQGNNVPPRVGPGSIAHLCESQTHSDTKDQ